MPDQLRELHRRFNFSSRATTNAISLKRSSSTLSLADNIQIQNFRGVNELRGFLLVLVKRTRVS